MNSEDSLKKLIDAHLPSPSYMELTASQDRLLRELRSMPPHLQRPRIEDAAPPVVWWRPALSLTAAAAVIVIVATISFQRGDWIATVEAADGSRYTLDANEVLRLSDAAMLTLTDGSHVEVRSRSELSLVRETDGLGIRLQAGDIIVNAAEQRGRHLYVHTKDMTVAVGGTVFLVNAGADGSRVAVIDGEVAVREGTVETTLRPGEQVATSAALAARPLTEAVAWSRRGGAYQAILANFEKGMANTSGPLRPLNNVQAAFGQAGPATASREFEEASIRECDPDNVPPAPPGARGGGANSFYMTPGRTYALCMTPATIIRHAYGYGPADLDFLNPGGRGRAMNVNIVYGLGIEDGRRVRGGPDWVRGERYTIEAVAAVPTDAETMRGPMLRALLESRFKLKAHIESEQIPAFALTMASNELKIKPVEGGACEPLPPATPGVPRTIQQQPRTAAEVRRGEKPNCGLFGSRNGPNQVFVGGEVTLEALGRALGSPLGGVQVFDKTGSTDKFNFIVEFVIDENTPFPPFLTLPPPPATAADVPRAPAIFTALEEQLGVRLERARAPREYIVIDSIERPGAN